MLRRDVLKGIAAAGAASAVGVRDAAAQDVIKIGACLSLVGGFQTVGRQALAGAKTYMAVNGDRVAGKKIELIVRDDTGVPDVARRIVQEMIVNEKVNIVLGGITPTALALSQLATQSKIPIVVIISGASVTIDRSPYMTRTSFTLGQSSMIMGQWAAKNGSKKVVTLVNDWAPGAESEAAFQRGIYGRRRRGDREAESAAREPGLRAVPAAHPRPQARHGVHLLPGPAGRHVRAPVQGARARSGQHQDHRTGRPDRRRRIAGAGGCDARRGHGAQLLGRARLPPRTRSMSRTSRKLNNFRPNFISVGGWDGMHLIYEALKKTNGSTDGDALMAAMKGMAWESPRGPISIDPETRDIVQNIYMRKVEKVNGELYNVEFDKVDAVKDPMKKKSS